MAVDVGQTPLQAVVVIGQALVIQAHEVEDSRIEVVYACRVDGSFKAPPHDNTGHTWHHADELLVELIAQGSDFPQATMPTFGDQLSDEEILTILEYLKSGWGPEERAFQWQVTWQAQQLK